ncbi:hypothetical protein OCC_14345 [Thermococcus litoralis DSM 5473]|uniref:Uncharacterized protein n=1 Tax=Thermococcus litoralis (strain ATCC 51850 / DSM 5473 / JCM 8560 / NS-C) TaxID=523849 RepID=S5ZIK6_THELN|nr:hypothetical protein [Thermococcus litoralis]AGT34346.1 hypothetical protein OCC_14345 [Thermococcus litoralis DSM 5473]
MKKKVWFIILIGLMLLQAPSSLGMNLEEGILTPEELAGLNLIEIQFNGHFMDSSSAGVPTEVHSWSYSARFNSPEHQRISIKIEMTIITDADENAEVSISKGDYDSFISDGYQCYMSDDYKLLECTKTENPTGMDFPHSSKYYGAKAVKATRVNVWVEGYFNNTNPVPSLGKDVLSIVSSKVPSIISSEKNSGSPPQVQILSPKDGETLYFEPGKPLTFTIKVAVKDDDLTYAGAHYESGTPKTIMVGGELEPKLGSSGGTGSKVVTLQPDEIAEGEGKIKAYARDSTGNEVEKTITVYLRKKPISTSSAVPSTSSTTPSVSSTTSTPPSSRAPIEGKQEAGDPSKFNNPFRGIRVEGMLSKEANVRMEITLDKLKGIGSTEGLETVEVKTPYGKNVKVLQKDEKVEAKKGSSLWFKLKYYTGKALDKVIDSASGALDNLVKKFMPSPIGLCKDYVKAYKDTQLFQGEEATKKTMQDLHVSKEGAESYNEMSGIEDRQLASSPYKNLVPSTPLTKPFEFTFGALEKGFKRHLANNYKWEFEKTAKTAMYYKKAGMKYEDIVDLTIRDVEEETSFSRQVQTMNAQSKGKYQSQRERLKFYLKKLREEGKI